MKSLPGGFAKRSSIDLWLCLTVSIFLAVHAALTFLDWQQPDWAHYVVRPLVLAGLVIVPGYAMAALARLERYGIAGFTGLTLALSLAILAIVGSTYWLTTNSFSVVALEAIIAALAGGLTLAALIRASGSHSADEPGAARSAALVLLMLPVLISFAAFSDELPVSPATRFTEFSVVTVQPESVVVRIVNHESSDRTYTVVAHRGSAEVQSEPITVAREQQADVTVAIPSGAGDELQIKLFRPGEPQPYRSLALRLRDSS